MLGVPLGHQVIGRLADVGPIGDVAAEGPRRVEGVPDLSVQAVGDPEDVADQSAQLNGGTQVDLGAVSRVSETLRVS